MKFGMPFGHFFGHIEPTDMVVSMDANWPDLRSMTFTPTHATGAVYHVYVDGKRWLRTEETTTEELPLDAREHIEILETPDRHRDVDLSRFVTTPSDVPKLTWSESGSADVAYYELFKSTESGSYTDDAIAVVGAGQSAYVYYDEALEDATYYYRLTVHDDAGNTTVGTEDSVTVSSAPEPPEDPVATVL